MGCSRMVFEGESENNFASSTTAFKRNKGNVDKKRAETTFSNDHGCI
jgi:hypothetical protein